MWSAVKAVATLSAKAAEKRSAGAATVTTTDGEGNDEGAVIYSLACCDN